MHIDKTVKAFQEGALEIDGVKVVLTQRKVGGHVFEGAGGFRSGSDGSLVFKLIAPDRDSSILLDSPGDGAFYADEMYFDLEIRELSGTVWKAERIRPRYEVYGDKPGIILSGNIESIESSHDTTSNNCYMRLHLFKQHDIPTNRFSEVTGAYVRDKAEFEVCGYEFEVLAREGSGQTVIDVIGDTEFPEKFEKRVEEAFQFLTAKTALIRAVYKTGPKGSTLKLIRKQFKVADSHFHAPLNTVQWIRHSEDAWKLFGAFLTYALLTKKYHCNPVAFHLWNARETAFGSIDARAVGVAVAVEAVCSLTGNRKSNVTSKEANNIKETITALLKQHEEKQEIINRISKMIATLPEKPTKSILHELVKQGHIETDYVEAWGKLRNKYVHPKINELKPPTIKKQHETILLTYKCEVLLYQLIMHVIGYQGRYTDYGTQMWEDKVYPNDVNR